MGHQAQVRDWWTLFASILYHVYRNSVHKPTPTSCNYDAQIPTSEEGQERQEPRRSQQEIKIRLQEAIKEQE
jgi:hypothetical protein